MKKIYYKLFIISTTIISGVSSLINQNTLDACLIENDCKIGEKETTKEIYTFDCFSTDEKLEVADFPTVISFDICYIKCDSYTRIYRIAHLTYDKKGTAKIFYKYDRKNNFVYFTLNHLYNNTAEKSEKPFGSKLGEAIKYNFTDTMGNTSTLNGFKFYNPLQNAYAIYKHSTIKI